MKIEIMQELESLKHLMEKNAQEEEMDYEELCENAVFDTVLISRTRLRKSR